MTTVQKYKRSLSAFISSDKGQRFFNFAYSIGAAIVIWGALFKILHLPGGNALLSIGMGTEVLMFVLTAFDKPAKEYKWEEVFPALRGKEEGDEDGAEGVTYIPAESHAVSHGGYAGGHGHAVSNGYAGVPGGSAGSGHAGAPSGAMPVAPADATPETVDAQQHYLNSMAALAEEMEQLHETTAALNQVSTTILQSYKAITENSAEISQASAGYVEQMKELHKNIQGLNTIYDLQLRSVSSQIDSIDRVNRGIKDIRDMYEKSATQSAHYCEETEKMARYMQQLNSVYEKMIHAMTINMYHPMMAPGQIVDPSNTQPAKDENA